MTNTNWQNNLTSELSFWTNYFKTKSYKYVKESHLLFFKKWFKVPIEIFSEAIILDVGSGPSSHLYDIEARIKVAIDPLMDKYEKITKNYEFPNDDVIKLKGRGEELPFTSESFDFVFTFNGIDHWADWQKGILEIKRVLKKNGKLLLYVVFDRPNPNPHHPFCIDEDSIKWIEEQGFKIIQSEILLIEKRRKFYGMFKKL